jgi:hypothetical protein
MNIEDAQDLTRWAAPKTWPSETVTQVAGLLLSGTSVGRVARRLRVESEGVARVRRVLQVASASAGHRLRRLRPAIW